MNKHKNTEADMTDIGAVLSARREELGLSVAAAALRSSLSVDLIEKLEANRFAEIGAPVFTRGYLVMYAKSLNLDDVVLGERFNSLKAEYELSISPANVAASQNKSLKRSYAKTWLWLIPVIIISFVLLQQLLDSKSWLMSQISRTFSTPVNVENNSDASTEVAPDVVLEVGGNTVSLNNPQQQINEKENTEANSENDDAVVPALTPVEKTTDTNISSVENNITGEQPQNITTENTGNDEKNKTTTDNSATTVSPSEPKGIVLHINRESWIQINNAKGKVVLSRTLKGGENIELPAAEAPYKLNIGRPGNVTLTINGQEQPLSNYSLSGSVRKFKVEMPDG